ncbi:MAG: hypothetical protein QM747_13615 [Nocardioides sp.]
MRVGKIVTLVIMAIGSMATVSTSVLELSQLMAQFTGGVGAIFVLRWLWWRINGWSEITAYLGSGALGLLLNFPAGLSLCHRVLGAIAPASLAPRLDHFFLTTLPGSEGWAYKLTLIAVLTTRDLPDRDVPHAADGARASASLLSPREALRPGLGRGAPRVRPGRIGRGRSRV